MESVWQPPRSRASMWPRSPSRRAVREAAAAGQAWGHLVDGGARRSFRPALDDALVGDVVWLVRVGATVWAGPHQLALHGPCALAAEHPLHPDEVRSALSHISGRRVLVTTPVHLRALCESAQRLPALDRVISATAPLALPLASRCELDWTTRVFEIYGCTETGMVAARRTVAGPLWTTTRGVRVERTGDGFTASGGHVQPGRLMDRLRLASENTFELEGRADDLVNIGGKRASLEGLNGVLLSIEGVEDGAFSARYRGDRGARAAADRAGGSAAVQRGRGARPAAHEDRGRIFAETVAARGIAAAQCAGQNSSH